MVPARKGFLQAKRSKVTLACVACRKKKVKCNGIRPTCDRCYAIGVVCHYTTENKKRGPTKRRVEIINNRAHRIESLLLLNQRHDDDPLDTLKPELSAGKQSNLPFFYQAGFNPVFRTIANAPRDHRFDSFGANITLFSEDTDVTISPDQQQLAWAHAVLRYFNVLFPILSRHHFLYQFTTQCHRATMDQALRFSVYALGACYQRHQARKFLFDTAINMLSVAGPLRVCLSTVQALVIMCWCAFLLGEMDSCRILRQRLALLKFDRPTTVIEEELYNRAAWVIYVMDQWLMVATNERSPMTGPPTSHRQPQLEDDQLLAIDSHREKKRKSVGKAVGGSDGDDAAGLLQITAFAETIRLADIVHRDPTDRNKLTVWLTELPSYLEHGSSVLSMSRLLHIFYHAIVLAHQKNTTAMQAMLGIAEQTEVRLLYNVFGPALTHAVSHCVCTSNRAYLDKALQILTTANPTFLSQTELDQLIKAELVQPVGLGYNAGLVASDDETLALIPDQPIHLSLPPPQLDLATFLQPPTSDMFTPWDSSPVITTGHCLASPALTMAATPADSFDASPSSFYLVPPNEASLSKQESHLPSETVTFSTFPLLQ